jgi:hypothetical protein
LDTASQNDKKNWSNQFADECAVMFADCLRSIKHLSKSSFEIYPTENKEKVEYLTGARGRGKGKRVDVAVTSRSAGLQIGVSLKGGNFLDSGSGFGKNITGRLYELLDETKAIHEYHPHSMICCVYLFPLQASMDKPKKSTFAKAVSALRSHTGRTDVFSVSQLGKFDKAYIGLYVHPSDSEGFVPNSIRFFDVEDSPPKVGRPKIKNTLSLSDLCLEIVEYYKGGEGVEIEYSDPE